AQGRQRFIALPQEHDRLHDVVVVVPDGISGGVLDLGAAAVLAADALADPAEPGLVADHDAFGARFLAGSAQRPAHDDVVNAHGNVIDAGDDDLADLFDPALFLGAQVGRGGLGVLHAEHVQHGILAASQ